MAIIYSKRNNNSNFIILKNWLSQIQTQNNYVRNYYKINSVYGWKLISQVYLKLGWIKINTRILFDFTYEY